MSNKTLVTGLEMVKVNALNNVVVSWKLVEENGEIGLYVKNSAVLECPYLRQASTPEECEARYQETIDAFLKTPNWLEVTNEHGLTDTILWPASVRQFDGEYSLVMSSKRLVTATEKPSTKSWLIPMVVVAAIVGVAGAICYSQKK